MPGHFAQQAALAREEEALAAKRAADEEENRRIDAEIEAIKKAAEERGVRLKREVRVPPPKVPQLPYSRPRSLLLEYKLDRSRDRGIERGTGDHKKPLLPFNSLLRGF